MRTQVVGSKAALVALTLWAMSPLAAWAQSSSAPSTAPGEAFKTSPFHRVINEATGKPIPCICRFQNRDFRVGEAVCMNTHLGVMIARCDLHLNNTSWVPTNEPCTVSRAPLPSIPNG
jgi:hypothetical protein